MNIFKVLASTPRSRFQENQVLAFLACLLNPFMDHGLGFEFLIRFLERINFENNIIEKLRLNMSNKNNGIDIEIIPEYDEFDAAIIDILLKIENHYISIENKIYSSSASNKEQLKTQYQCFQDAKELKSKSINMVFVVPDKNSQYIKSEYNNLVVNNTDKKEMISWTEISEDIQKILEMERNCIISPIDEYSRNTLKAFSVFIKDKFEGYIYKELNSNSINKKAIGRIKLAGILIDESITYIGVIRGEAGLMKMEVEELESKKFQYTNGEQRPNHFWIRRDRFLNLVNDIKSKENEK